jgi:tetratricopeptide (TPR) repeat protein
MANENFVEIQDMTPDELKDKANSFVEEYKNLLLGALLAVCLIGGGLYYYYKIYLGPQKSKAQIELYRANIFMDKDSFSLALNGKNEPGQASNLMGYTGIIENFGGTPAANLAHYYAGIATLNLGKPEVALSFLKEFSGEELLQTQAYSLMGDASSELGDFDLALSYYDDAANNTDNVALKIYALHKSSRLLEYQQKNADAVVLLEQIMDLDIQIAEKIGADKDLVRLK